MDISGRYPYPAGHLSNFYPHKFVFEGVECASMEGLLQSLKFRTPEAKKMVCGLSGYIAKRKGSIANKQWQSRQTLCWKRRIYPRREFEYQRLLDQAFDALSRNRNFRRALLATGDQPLTHKIGKSDPALTVLTEREFISRLLKLRSRYLKRLARRRP